MSLTEQDQGQTGEYDRDTTHRERVFFFLYRSAVNIISIADQTHIRLPQV